MKKFIKSMSFATRGIFLAAREQQNLRIHLVVMVIFTVVGIYLNLSAIEWCIIILAIGLVVVAEMINTAIEYMVNIASPEYHILARNTKDVAAAAVLMAAIFASVVILTIFGNKFFNLLFQ